MRLAKPMTVLLMAAAVLLSGLMVAPATAQSPDDLDEMRRRIEERFEREMQRMREEFEARMERMREDMERALERLGEGGPEEGPPEPPPPSEDFAYLGISVRALDEGARVFLDVPEDRGVLVEEIVAEGPADGVLEPMDILLTIAGEPVATEEAVALALLDLTPGQAVAIEILRGGEAQTVTVTLGHRPGYTPRPEPEPADPPASLDEFLQRAFEEGEQMEDPEAPEGGLFGRNPFGGGGEEGENPLGRLGEMFRGLQENPEEFQRMLEDLRDRFRGGGNPFERDPNEGPEDPDSEPDPNDPMTELERLMRELQGMAEDDPQPEPDTEPAPEGRPWFGIMADNREEGAGVIVTEVTEAGPAAEGGLQVDDVIIALNGEPILDKEDLRVLLGILEPGQEITITVIREGEQIELTVTLGSR